MQAFEKLAKILNSVTRTIRLDEFTDELLKKIAEEEHVSSNQIISRAVTRFVQWDFYTEDLNPVAIPSALLKKIVECLTEDEVESLGRWLSENMYAQTLLVRYGEIGMEQVVSSIKIIGKYSGYFRVMQSPTGKSQVIVLKHDLGHKWSLLLKSMIESTMNLFCKEPGKVEYADDSCTVWVGKA